MSIEKSTTVFGNFNTKPVVVLVIGEDPIVLNGYTLTTNNLLESDTFSTTISLELFDISKLYSAYTKPNSIISLELWCGYVDTNESQTVFIEANSRSLIGNDPNNDLKNFILNNYKNILHKRWHGFLSNIDFSLNSTGRDVATISGLEIIQMLDLFAYEAMYSDASCQIQNIIQDLNKNSGNFKLTLDPKLPQSIKTFNMGVKQKFKQDGEGKQQEKIEYSTKGKTRFQIIKEIADKLDLALIQTDDNFSYMLTFNATTENTYEIDRAIHFQKLQLRTAKLGSVANNGHNVYVLSTQSNGAVNVGRSNQQMPKQVSLQSDLTGGNVILNAPPDIDVATLDAIALRHAQQLAKFSLSGNFYLPNAIFDLKANDTIRFIDSSKYADNRNLTNFIKYLNEDAPYKNMSFLITSITETFSINQGVTASVEISLNPAMSLYDKSTGELIGKQLVPKIEGKVIINDEENNMPMFLRQKMQENFI